MINLQHLSSILMTARIQIDLFFANQSRTLVPSLITTRTFIDKNITDALDSNNHLKIDKQKLIQVYAESLNEIHLEYEGAQTESEIAYVFSSSGFRVLLGKACYPKSDNTTIVGGYYDYTANFICLNIEESLSFAFSLEEFKNILKEFIRHEFHHAFKSILHAPFYKRPEVPVPCLFHTEFRMDRNTYALVPDYTSYKFFVNNDEITQPLFPFDTIHREAFIHAMKSDIENLKKILLSEELSTDLRALELKKSILEHYKPSFWHHYFDEKNDNKTIGNITDAIQKGVTHCIDMTSEEFGFEKTNLTLCVRNLKSVGNLLKAEGFSVPEGNDKILAFVRDIDWRKVRVSRYDRNAHLHGYTLLEMDAWLYMIPQQLFRMAFPSLEKLRVDEFLKFDHRKEILTPCLSFENPESLHQCLQQLCTNDFLLTDSLNERVKKLYRFSLLYHTSCDFDNLDCFIQYIKKSLRINLTDPEFNRLIDPFYLENQWRNNVNISGRGHLNCEPIPIYFSDLMNGVISASTLLADEIYNNIPPWYFILLTIMFSYRHEIVNMINNQQNKLLASEPAISKKHRTNVGFVLKVGFSLYLLLIKGKELLEYGLFDEPEMNTPFENAFVLMAGTAAIWHYSLISMQMKTLPRYFDMLSFENPITESLSQTFMRFKFSFSETACYDIISNTKQYYKEKRDKNKKKFSYFDQINTISKGCFFSLGKITWKYCASPIISGGLNIISSLKTSGDGIIDYLERAIDSLAENIIPGAKEIFAAQDKGFKDYEERLKNAQASLKQSELHKEKQHPASVFQKARQLPDLTFQKSKQHSGSVLNNTKEQSDQESVTMVIKRFDPNCS